MEGEADGHRREGGGEAVNKVLFQLLLIAALGSCGGRTASVPGAGKPLSTSITLVEGDADARNGGDWTPLQTRAGVHELRSHSGGLVVIGDPGKPIGKLSLRAGAVVAIGEADDGIRLVIESGAARYRAFDATTKIAAVVSGKTVELTGRDVVLETAALVDTATHPEAAAFSFAIGKAGTAGVGTMETKNEAGEKGTLALVALNVEGKTAGELVETSVEHIFHNDTDARLEGTFRFPLPKGAILNGLAMQIDDKLMEGELVERDKARKVYESIVDSMRDPALLEWEHGSTFKLRVFPIEPKSDKRVVLRFLAPAHDGVKGREWIYSAHAPGLQTRLPKFELKLDGKTVADHKDWSPVDVVVPLATVGGAFFETRKEGSFVSLRITPDWSKVAAPPPSPKQRRVVLLIDTSRSVLEERALIADAIRGVLDALRPNDRFAVITGDVDVRETAPFADASPASIKSALAAVAAIEPDGASDLGAALAAVGKRLKETPGDDLEVVYIGDGTPTWGQTDKAALTKLADDALGATPLHAVLVGKGGDDAALRAIAKGRVASPHGPEEVARFATALAHAREVKRLDGITIDAGDGAIVHRSTDGALFEGDGLDVYVKSSALPKSITLKGSGNFLQTIPLEAARPAPHVAKLWASHELATMEASGAEKEAIVTASLAYGVMSKHTSWLVLESEDAYAQWNIARKNKAADGGDPKVTGVDLESVGSHASMTPDHLQPGDPEVHIPAPSDARSVVAVLPSGETKLATYEPALGKWTLRFLVDKDVPDGTYEISVRVVHADGAVELQKIAYHVDTRAPVFVVTAKRVADGYELRAVQLITDEEARAGLPAGELAGADLAALKEKYAQVLTDSKRLEVKTPDGQSFALDGVKLGTFRGVWKTKLAGPQTLTFVAVDRALNERTFDVTVTP